MTWQMIIQDAPLMLHQAAARQLTWGGDASPRVVNDTYARARSMQLYLFHLVQS